MVQWQRVVASVLVLWLGSSGVAIADDAQRAKRGVHEVKSSTTGEVITRYEYVTEKGRRVKHGKYEELFPLGGPHTTGTYDHGQRTGKWTIHDKRGRKVFEKTYVDDVLEGTHTQFSTSCDQPDQVWATTTYLHGKKHGPYNEHNCARKKTVEGNYEANERQGTWRYYGLSGDHLTSIGAYECGMKSGNWQRLDAKGAVTRTETHTPDPVRLETCKTYQMQVAMLIKLLKLVLGAEINSCVVKESEMLKRTPCNIFAGLVLEKLFGIDDLRNGPGYLGAGTVHEQLLSGKLANWRMVSAEEAQRLANQGRPVLASSSGHIAIVIPGVGTRSPGTKEPRWKGVFAPHGVSLFLDDRLKVPRKNAYRCMPCTLNVAFGLPPLYFVRGASP